MSDAPSRYPLAWPVGRPRTKNRTRGKFSETVEGSKTKPVTMTTACERVETEVDRLGGIYPILSTNLELRMDGRPRLDRGPPADPGVCLYFRVKDRPYAMACDTYTEVSQNIAAIAAHIEASRRQARYGVATAAETLEAFAALPAPDHVLPGQRPWRHVLGFDDTFPFGMGPIEARERVNKRYRAKAIENTGEAELADLNVARDAALKELQG